MAKQKKRKGRSASTVSNQAIGDMKNIEENPSSIDDYYPPPSQQYPHCHQQIGTKAYELLRYKTGPVLVATMAVELSLALLRRGSEGSTEDALGMALDMRTVREIVFDNYQAYMTGREDSCSSCECRSVNLLLVDEAYTLETEFSRSAANGFLIKCLTLPLFEDPQGSVGVVNDLVRVLTGDAVVDPLQIDDLKLNPGPLALVSALYFKGRWKYPFREDKTIKGRFTSATTSQPQNPSICPPAEMMFCKGHFGYLALPTLKSKMLILPFADDDLVLLLALPNHATGMDELEQRLPSIRLTDVLTHASHPEVSVWLPKFTLEGVNDLGKELGHLGLSHLGDPERVQLPFMSRKPGLYLGAFVQKVVLEVTSHNCDNPAYPRPPQVICSEEQRTFKADHPFIFFVMNQYTGWVLCAGRYEG